MRAAITDIEFHLPTAVVSNDALAPLAANWTPQKILEKTGIAERRVASNDQYSSDLAVQAAEKLFSKGRCQKSEIDYVLFCTQSPDYLLPTTACLIQDRLQLPTGIGAIDFNLGCSGYVYGLGLARGLIETDQARNVLLLTADTYSKFLEETDIGVRSLFGDGAAATLVSSVNSCDPLIGPFSYGTDGRGGPNLILKRHSVRSADNRCDESGLNPDNHFLQMNGPEIFSFALEVVPSAVKDLLQKAKLAMEDIDLFVFHQANQYMLSRLRNKLQIPEDKFVLAMHDCGNTVSSTIPIALHSVLRTGRLTPGMTVMLVGFGVGYSWGATIIAWPKT